MKMVKALTGFRERARSVLRNLGDAQKVIRLEQTIENKSVCIQKMDKQLADANKHVDDMRSRAANYRLMLVGLILRKGVNGFAQIPKNIMPIDMNYSLKITEDKEFIKLKLVEQRKEVKRAV